MVFTVMPLANMAAFSGNCTLNCFEQQGDMLPAAALSDPTF